jgi:outer membrane protein
MNIIKYFNIIILIFLLLINFNKVNSDEPIVYVNLNKILLNSLAGKSLNDKLNKRNDLNSKKFQKKLATLKSKEQDIISKKNVLNPDDFQKKVNDLKNEFVLYKKLADEASKSFNKKKYNSEVALMKSLNLVLSDYSKNNDILIILDKKHILFAKTELEITDKIMNELNKKIKDIKLEK